MTAPIAAQRSHPHQGRSAGLIGKESIITLYFETPLMPQTLFEKRMGIEGRTPNDECTRKSYTRRNAITIVPLMADRF